MGLKSRDSSRSELAQLVDSLQDGSEALNGASAYQVCNLVWRGDRGNIARMPSLIDAPRRTLLGRAVIDGLLRYAVGLT